MGRVLVLGSTGMLGHMVLEVLSLEPGLAVEGTHRLRRSDPLYLDAEQPAEALPRLLRRSGGYDYLVNCIGVLKSDIREDDPESLRRAVAVNGLFPYHLAAAAAEAGARVIHVSTDGVFSGAARRPYREDSPLDCADAYGMTKSLGEVRAPRVLNLRCSLIGPDPRERKGLLEWFLGQPDGARVTGYTSHAWNGVTTLQFAEVCRALIARNAFDRARRESAVHHFCPNRPVTKYGLLEIFKSAFSKKVALRKARAPGPPVRRVLATKHRTLQALVPWDQRVEQAVGELARTMRKTY